MFFLIKLFCELLLYYFFITRVTCVFNNSLLFLGQVLNSTRKIQISAVPNFQQFYKLNDLELQINNSFFFLNEAFPRIKGPLLAAVSMVLFFSQIPNTWSFFFFWSSLKFLSFWSNLRFFAPPPSPSPQWRASSQPNHPVPGEKQVNDWRTFSYDKSKERFEFFLAWEKMLIPPSSLITNQCGAHSDTHTHTHTHTHKMWIVF